jgi:hypothetical protein
MIRVDNLYHHVDGGLYCLLSDDTPLKCPVTGDWLPGVTYLSPDGKMRSTTQERWADRFDRVAAIPEDKLTEEQMAMVRRANPGSLDFDFVQTLESWHESEMAITGQMLELAIAVCAEKMIGDRIEQMAGEGVWSGETEITITADDMQRVLQTYEIERVPIQNGFTVRLKKAT